MGENGKQCNRIAELEKDLQIAQQGRRQYRAAIMAILQIMNADKQRYRSKAAANVHACLGEVLEQARFRRQPEPTEELVLEWFKMFKEFIVKE